MDMKEIAKIGKTIIRQLSSGIEQYMIIDNPNTPGHSCPYENVEDEKLRQKLCELNCDIKPADQPKVFVQHKRLSKLQMLQLLYYHFLPIDSRGVILGISEKSVAQALNCTVRSVQNNNKVLEETGIIYSSNCGEGRINVMILPYKQYHATKEEGGSGYLSMSVEFFELLLHVKNVNALRMELRKLLVYDNDTAKRIYGKSEVSHISKNDWKLFLPKYTHTQTKLESIIEDGTEAFKTTAEHATVYFVMDSRYNGKLLKEQKEQLYSRHLSDLLSTTFLFMEKRDTADLVQLCFEYSYNEVHHAIEEWLQECAIDEQKKMIQNIGGYIRTVIRKNRHESLKQLPPLQITA